MFIPTHFPVLPVEERVNLRQRLLEAFANALGDPPNVTTQLCVALASLAVYAVPDTWSNVVEDIFSIVSVSDSHRSLAVFLEFLIAFPQEASSAEGSSRFEAIEQELAQARERVLSLTLEHLATSTAAIQCVTSWVEHVKFSLTEATEHINVVCQLISEVDCSAAAFDACIDLLITVSGHVDICDSVEGAFAFMPVLVALASSHAAAIDSGDAERVDGICR